MFRLCNKMNLNLNLQVVSLNYSDSHDDDLRGDEIRVHRFIFENHFLNEFEVGQPMLVRITNRENGLNRIVCIGAPHLGERNVVYIPQWIIENLGLETFLSWINIEPFHDPIPNATMIYLKPMDSAIYHTDIRECFERALDRYHVLEVGSMLSIFVESLGGYEVNAYVERLEPGSIVRLGGEVNVEFLEPDGGIPEFRPPTPIPNIDLPIINDPTIQESDDYNNSETLSTPNPIPTQSPDYNAVREAVRQSWLRKIEHDRGQC
jgi:hypothetical protein